MASCQYDTNNDGDCHLCHRTGKCHFDDDMEEIDWRIDWFPAIDVIETRHYKGSEACVAVSRVCQANGLKPLNLDTAQVVRQSDGSLLLKVKVQHPKYGCISMHAKSI